MVAFSTAIIESFADVELRLADFGLTPDQLRAIGDSARTWADDASPLMPLNAPGTLAYIFGVHELRQQLVGSDWHIDRTCGIEAVINRNLNVRIGYQNVDRACDAFLKPNPRSAKGSASESLCGPSLFEYVGMEPGPLTGVKQDGIPTYCVMVGDDGSVELSHPIIMDGSYKHFNERIFVRLADDPYERDRDTDPLDDFDVAVTFKG